MSVTMELRVLTIIRKKIAIGVVMRFVGGNRMPVGENPVLVALQNSSRIRFLLPLFLFTCTESSSSH